MAHHDRPPFSGRPTPKGRRSGHKAQRTPLGHQGYGRGPRLRQITDRPAMTLGSPMARFATSRWEASLQASRSLSGAPGCSVGSPAHRGALGRLSGAGGLPHSRPRQEASTSMLTQKTLSEWLHAPSQVRGVDYRPLGLYGQRGVHAPITRFVRTSFAKSALDFGTISPACIERVGRYAFSSGSTGCR